MIKKFVGNRFSIEYDVFKDERVYDIEYTGFQVVEIKYNGKPLLKSNVSLDGKNVGTANMFHDYYSINTNHEKIDFLCKVLATYESVLEGLQDDYNDKDLLAKKDSIEKYLKATQERTSRSSEKIDRLEQDVEKFFEEKTIKEKFEIGDKLTDKHAFLKAKKEAMAFKLSKIGKAIKMPFAVLRAKVESIRENIKTSREERAKRQKAIKPTDKFRDDGLYM